MARNSLASFPAPPILPVHEHEHAPWGPTEWGWGRHRIIDVKLRPPGQVRSGQAFPFLVDFQHLIAFWREPNQLNAMLRATAAAAERVKETLANAPVMIAASFAQKVQHLEDVEDVYWRVSNGGEVVHIWTVVNRDDFDLRKLIYAAMDSIYAEFPKARLDLYVLTKSRLPRGKSLSTMIPSGFTKVERIFGSAITSRLSG